MADKLSTSSQTQWVQTDGATFFLMDVQLEDLNLGIVVQQNLNTFMFSEQLIRCQRHYYQMVHDSNRRFGIDGLYPSGQVYGQMTIKNLCMEFTHPVPMRFYSARCQLPLVTPGSSMKGRHNII